ncbi:MAG: adenylosuccinate synthetase, partial [Candidatus Aminicenantales bacterium]
QDLSREGGLDSFRPKTGLPLATYFSGPKIEWILENVTPVYRTLPGWRNSVRGASDVAVLPRPFRDYLRLLEDLIETRVAIISTGVEREETILLSDGLEGLVDLGKLRGDRAI